VPAASQFRESEEAPPGLYILTPAASTLHFESVADEVSRRSYSDEVLQRAELSDAKLPPYRTREHPASPPRDGPRSPEPAPRWKLIPLDLSPPRLTRPPRDLLKIWAVRVRRFISSFWRPPALLSPLSRTPPRRPDRVHRGVQCLPTTTSQAVQSESDWESRSENERP